MVDAAVTEAERVPVDRTQFALDPVEWARFVELRTARACATFVTQLHRLFKPKSAHPSGSKAHTGFEPVPPP